MRLRLKWMIIAAAVAAAAAAYAELVLDIRTPRASLSEVHGITSSVAIPLGDYQEAMKKKYGPNADTVFMNRPPRTITSVGGKIVEEDNTPGKFSDARGVFVIGQRGRLESTFPFEIDPRVPPISGSVGKPSAQYLRTRFGGNFPAKYLQFDDRDVLTDKCVTISPTDLGWFGEALRFRSGVFCVVFWKGASPSSMLIGVALADGDPWMRPFNRRICRWLTATALARVAATDHEPLPDMPPACWPIAPIAPIARARPRRYRRGCMKYVEMAPWLS
jgi:rhodanese-related sulfurtransferase